MIPRWLEVAALLTAGALAATALRREPEVVYRDVIVPQEVILEREPPARPPTVIERIRFVSIEPRQIATAPGGGQGTVSAFCAPSVAAAVGDTATAPAPTILLRAGRHSPGWWLGRDELLLTGVTSVGDLRAFDYTVRPGFDFTAHGDSVLVRYPRTALVRQGLEVGVPLFLGILLGHALW